MSEKATGDALINYKTIADVNVKSLKFATHFTEFRKSLQTAIWEQGNVPFVQAGNMNEGQTEFEVNWCGRSFVIALDRFPAYLDSENGGPAFRIQSGKLSVFQLETGEDGLLHRQNLGTALVNQQGYASETEDGSGRLYSLGSDSVPLFFCLIGMRMSEDEI